MSDYRIEAATKEEWAERALAAEAKLAKAVEGLRFYGGVMPVSFSPGQDGGAKARSTLAELTGGKDE